MSPALSRAFDPLRFRPLLWLAMAALMGVALGGQWVAFIQPVSRSSSWLWLPLLPAIACALVALIGRGNGLIRRLGLAGVVCFLFACASSRRIVPPQGDISLLTHLDAIPVSTIETTPVKVTGTVADYPRIGDFNVQFPLECRSPRPGRIWITAPYDQKFQIGERVEFLTELRSLPHPGDPGERDSSWRYIAANCWCLGRRVVVARRLGVAPGYRLARSIAGLRERLLRHYEAQFRGARTDESLRLHPFPTATAQLLTAMVFGEGGLSRPLPTVLLDDFRVAGMSHVLVSSGSQVAFLAGLVVLLTRILGVRRFALLLWILPILVFYALLAGGAASIWRATLGGAMLGLSVLLGRDLDGLSVWAAAVLVLLCLDPAVAWSLSFQLTFAATWGMLVVSQPLAKLFEKRFEKSWFLQLVAFSLGAQFATLPLSLLHFGTFSVLGIFANFLAMPLAEVMIFTGLFGLIVPWFNFFNYYLARGAASLAHCTAQLPGAYYEGSPITLSVTFLMYFALLLAITPISLDFSEISENLKEAFEKFKREMGPPRPRVIGAVLVAFAIWLLWLQYGAPDSRLRITMLDVGQGESILIRTPSGQSILVDGGSLETQPRSNIGAQVIVPALQSLGVDRLDLLVLTHADADHCNGLAEVAREIPVDAFLDGPAAFQNAPDPAEVDYFELRKVLAARGVKTIKPAKGQLFSFGAVQMKLLAPASPPLSSENENCIVSRLDFGRSSILLTGDIEGEAEQRLLQNSSDLQCTVLKVAHHGSKGSSSAPFLKAANPKIALISVGRYNTFGHPGAVTLHRLMDRNATTFRTDVNGAIEVDCDEGSCHVSTFK